MKAPWRHVTLWVFWQAILTSVVAGAQLIGPTSAPSAGPATAHKALPAAWLRLTMNLGPHRNAAANARATTIEATLPGDKGERVLAAVRIASLSDFESATEAGKLTFRGIPTKLPMWLRISIRSTDDTVVCSYARSYVLRSPEQARTAKIGFTRALEESGYLGDFRIDPVDAEITRTVTLQPDR